MRTRWPGRACPCIWATFTRYPSMLVTTSVEDYGPTMKQIPFYGDATEILVPLNSL